MRETHEDQFYRAFEDRYRGSRELILSRLRFYLPFIEPLQGACNQPTAVDIGCGRGEWLELIGLHGFQAHGVDINEAMLEACRRRGLDVTNADAIGHLAQLEPASQMIVSAFHVVEHLPFAAVRRLVQEADRVLMPGGLLILETPNPENLLVATKYFYLDPTHTRPVPPELLSFVCEYQGFERTKVVRLDQWDGVKSLKPISIANLFECVSPDYSVVAQKGGNDKLLSATAEAFARDYGVTFLSLAARFDDDNGREREERDTDLQRLRTAVADLQRLGTTVEDHRKSIEGLQQQIASMFSSTSWRITAPLREIKYALVFCARATRASTRIGGDFLVQTIARYPSLKMFLKRSLNAVPPLKRRAIMFAQNRGYRPTVPQEPHDEQWHLDPASDALRLWESRLGIQKCHDEERTM